MVEKGLWGTLAMLERLKQAPPALDPQGKVGWRRTREKGVVVTFYHRHLTGRFCYS